MVDVDSTVGYISYCDYYFTNAIMEIMKRIRVWQPVQTVPHTIYQKGVGEMREPPKIINCIEIDGKEVLFNDLSEEQRKQISQVLLDNFMDGLGYKRRTA